MAAHAPTPGVIVPAWEDPARQSREAFRAILSAQSRPGSISPCGQGLDPPAPLTPAAAAVALCLCDHDTPVWLDRGLAVEPVERFLRFHAGCPVVEDPEHAHFAFLSNPRTGPPLSTFNPGTAEYPDRSATIVIQVDDLENAPAFVLRGPGIEDSAQLDARPLPEDFASQWKDNSSSFPLGVDLLLASGERLAALPRSIEISE